MNVTLAFAVLLTTSPLPSESAAAASYTVTGVIRTPTGNNPLIHDVPVKYMRVIVMDEDEGFDDVMDTGYTDASGAFSITFSAFLGNPDIYINVEYVGLGVNGQVIIVKAAHTDSNAILDENVEDTIHVDTPPGTLNLGTLRAKSTRAVVVSELGDAVRNLDALVPAWVMPETMQVQAVNAVNATHVASDGSYISIGIDDWNNPGIPPGYISNIHHEAFHWIAYRAYGNRWTAPSCTVPGDDHNDETESCEAFALEEGAAQYFAFVSAVQDGGIDPIPSDAWRGDDGTGNNHSGEIVEGALDRTWRDLGDPPGVFRAILTQAPDSMMEFKDGYAVDQGSTSAAVQSLLDQCAENGIVYTRGKLDAFTPADPPDMAPPSNVNFKIIDNIAFARGDLPVSITELTKGELRLAATSAPISADQKDLGVKPAVAGLAEADANGFSFIGAVPMATDLIWSTGNHADGDYDLIARTRNIHEWWDNFLPDFTGDSSPPVDSTEKWLKTLGTWYNQDNVPDNDDEGMIIVDNTAPTVSNFQPQ